MNRIITGKRGTGKSLVAVAIAYEYLNRGCPVVTNLDFYPENMSNKYNDTIRIYRIPDVVEARHLRNIPIGNPTLVSDSALGGYKAGPNFDEKQNGLIIVDELLHSGNSRTWNQKGRQELIEEINLLRKRGYDTIFIAQDKSMVDKQILGSSADEIGYCRRLDRVNVPFLSPIFKLFTGRPLKFPKIHMCTLRLGENESDPISERRTYRGAEYYNLYNSFQEFTSTYEHETHCLLTPWHLEGRYMKPRKSFIQKVIHATLLTVFAASYAVCAVCPPLRKHFGYTPNPTT